MKKFVFAVLAVVLLSALCLGAGCGRAVVVPSPTPIPSTNISPMPNNGTIVDNNATVVPNGCYNNYNATYNNGNNNCGNYNAGLSPYSNIAPYGGTINNGTIPYTNNVDMGLMYPNMALYESYFMVNAYSHFSLRHWHKGTRIDVMNISSKVLEHISFVFVWGNNNVISGNYTTKTVDRLMPSQSMSFFVDCQLGGMSVRLVDVIGLIA